MFAFVALAWFHQFILQTVSGKYLGTEMLMVNISISMFPCFIAVCKGPGDSLRGNILWVCIVTHLKETPTALLFFKDKGKESAP